ncbi:tetratricopeptide repeat protein [Nannocystis punicea]|uniref:Tetratricopeptide repeat protein n=1 Tax=Nannocystis punicea TaxID=2995304 RepID=A0ABY7GX46_9BACT|nr:tetratricopeptide repeat protein [Nannocystis poenicansa]WAS91444.1 tetratricopeptide repeat protein [Nannocystis poenicansa]
MRSPIEIASISIVAVALTACGPKGAETKVPDGSGPGGQASQPDDGAAIPEASAAAKTDFAAAVKTYHAIKQGGPLSGDACERAAGAFHEVYQAHGAPMAIAEFNAGVVREQCGQTDKAEAIYEQLIAAVPKFDLAYNNLGVIYWKKGQEAKALELFKRGVEADKLTAQSARNNVAGLLRNQYVGRADGGAFTEAERSLQTVLSIDSNNQTAYENLARIYYDRGRRRDKSYLVLANLVVTQGLRVLKERGRESPDLYNIQGLLLLEREDQVNALRAFKEATRIEPGHVEANLNIAFISIRFRDYATAEKVLQLALKDPRQAKNVEAHLALGVAQRGLKKFKDAESSYTLALRLDATDPRPLFNLGVLYQDHISTQDSVDEKANVKLITVAKGHYDKFLAVAGADKKWKHEVLLVKDRIATIDESIRFAGVAADLRAKAAELAAQAKAAELAEQKRLLELERQAEDAEAKAAGTGQ